MSADRKVPEIRFKGFSEEWEEKELNNEVELFSGLTYSPSDIRKSGTLVLRSSNVKNGQLIEADNIYVNPEVVNCSNVVEGDIIVVVRNGSRSLIGKHAQVISRMDHTVIGAFMTGIRSKQPTFINALLDTNMFVNEVEKNLGATINQITNGSFKSMVFMFPTEKEQITIGNYFQKLDTQINQHQNKHDKLCNIKKAMLEKMFPKQGKTIPEIRFKGFSGEWEEKAIYELFTVTRGNVLSVTKTSPIPTLYKCYPVYSSQTKNNGLMGFYDKYLFETAITWTTDGANAGTVNFREGKFYSTNVNGVLLSNEGYVNKAIAEILNKEAWRHVSHVGNPKLMNNVMSLIKITIPKSIAEQIAISNYFQKLDNLINQHQQQITKLNNIKQACLSKMFV